MSISFGDITSSFGFGSAASFGSMVGQLTNPTELSQLLGAQPGGLLDIAKSVFQSTPGLPQGLSQLLGQSMAPQNFAPSPFAAMQRAPGQWSRSYSTPAGTHTLSREQLGGAGPMGRLVGQSMERALLEDPELKSKLEQRLGGRVVPDGRVDGRVTVSRFQPRLTGMTPSAQMMGDPMTSGIYQSLARMEQNMQSQLGALTEKSGGTSGASGLLSDPDTAGMAEEMGMSEPMSFEDMLFLMMLKYAKNKEKQILDKSQELMNKSESSSSSDSTSSTSGTSGTSGYDPMDSESSDATDQAVLQKMMNDLQKVYTLLTNVMKSMHDMQMASVRNIR